MKQKKIKIILAIILVLGLAVLVFLNLPKPVMSHDAIFDLMQIADGSYHGSCDNGLVKVRVDVVIENHTITDTVVQRKSVEVDTISGATMSSKKILKAVENALSEGQKIK